MPELPEVESIRRVLKNSLINQKLQKYKIFDQRINRFNTVNPRNLGVLLEIYRKGKILQFNFKNNSIFFHLGMSGRLDLNGIKNKHTHGIFFFDEDVLHYDDIRKFGYIKILKNDLANKQFAILGPDALSLSKLDKIFVMNEAKKSSTSIKKFLLDFISMPPTQRELDEKLEQLRIIDTSKIGISLIKEEILGVDTKEDLDRVNRLILKNE